MRNRIATQKTRIQKPTYKSEFESHLTDNY